MTGRALAMNAPPLDRPEPATLAPPVWAGWIRRKNHIGPITLTALTILGCLPLVMASARILALPWATPPLLAGIEPLVALGEFLERSFTLEWVPADARPKIFYLLLIPTGALLVAIARITFGLRVLGLRAILLAIGFQAIGVLPSFVLLTIVVGAVLLFRPWTRRIKLPMYGRLSAILCLCVSIMVGALLISPNVGSEAIWRFAFFPAIIMAMVAEAVARTLESHDLVMAIWRVVWTIILALLIFGISGAASLLAFHYPELILTELVAVVLVAEFFHLRLLEEWPERFSRYFAGVRPWYTPKPKVAVVRNRRDASDIAPADRSESGRRESRSVQPHVTALREQGFEVKVFEGDQSLLRELSDWLPTNPGSAARGIVLNLSTGVRGAGRFSHIPAMLEIAGIPYTGPDPQSQSRLSDRYALLTLLEKSRVPVPPHKLISEPGRSAKLELPASARPRYEPDATRIVVRKKRGVEKAVREIRSVHDQPTVLESIVRGREINVAVLGNETLECLPLVERGDDRVDCPASLEPAVADEIRACARAAFRAAGCRDYARIKVRLSADRGPVVIDVIWIPSFARRGAFALAAEKAGYSFGALMRRVVTEAAARYPVRPSAALAPRGSATMEPAARGAAASP